MLAGAIWIIIDAPKCSAPTPLKWWQEGPFAEIRSAELNVDEIDQIKPAFASAVVYELDGDDTYRLDSIEVENKIKKLVQHLKTNNLHLILDITPNYAHKTSNLFQLALKNNTQNNPFIWENRPANDEPTTWKRVGSNVSAWEKVDSQFVLSQFGEGRYDLQFKNSAAVNALKEALLTLIKWGVEGFRIANAKHLIIGDLTDEALNPDANADVHTHYNGQLHVYTTYQEGINDILVAIKASVDNATDNNGFLSVSDSIVRPEFFGAKQPGDKFIVDLPKYGRLTQLIAHSQNASLIYNELLSVTKNYSNSWFQWDLETTLGNLGVTEYFMFLVGLPGVPIARGEIFDKLVEDSNGTDLIDELKKIRKSSSFMHGSYDIYYKNSTVAYSR